MPFIQKATPNYFGFQPVAVGGANTNFQVNPYLVSSSAGEIAEGDVVIFTSSGIINTVISMAVAPSPGLSSTFPMVGVAAMTLLANTGSTAATINSNSSQMLFVYDSPLQFFVGCDTSSFGISSTQNLGKHLGVNTTGIVGSTGNFQTGKANARSVMTLAGNTASSGTYLFTLVGLHPVEQGVYSTNQGATGVAATDVRKWIVQPFNHVFGLGGQVALSS